MDDPHYPDKTEALMLEQPWRPQIVLDSADPDLLAEAVSRLGVASEEKELVVHPGPTEVPVILSVLPYLAGTITLIRAGIDFIRYLRSKGKAPF